MSTYTIQTQQLFHVTYTVEADSAGEAWELLLAGGGSCLRQTPGSIAVPPGEAVIEADDAPALAAPQPYRIERNSSVPLTFDGWRLSHVDSRDLMTDHQRRYRDRWCDVSIYRTTSGKWVVAQLGLSREA